MDGINRFRNKMLKEDLFNINAEKYVKKIKYIENILIWGSSSTGQLVYELAKRFGFLKNIKYFADNNGSKWGTVQNGLTVLSPDEVKDKVEVIPNLYIIIASQRLHEIREQLLSMGVYEENIDLKGFRLAWDYLSYEEETPYNNFTLNIKEYAKVYSLLTDERSKDVYSGVLNYKLSLDYNYLKDIASPSKDQYFEKGLIKLSKNEVFCDCGSFNGDTLEKFIGISGGDYNKYIAIEADAEIYNELNKRVNTRGYHNVKTYNLACWDKKTTLNFHSEQTSGKISSTGDISVNADALDNILEDEKITFIKMDIEGAEEMALKGSTNIIRKNKPILAICLYHSIEDYYKLPLLIKELFQDYKLFIRHYTDFAVETVCYAIPKDRLAK